MCRPWAKHTQFSIGTQFLPADFASQVTITDHGPSSISWNDSGCRSGGQTLNNLTAFGEALRNSS